MKWAVRGVDSLLILASVSAVCYHTAVAGSLWDERQLLASATALALTLAMLADGLLEGTF